MNINKAKTQLETLDIKLSMLKLMVKIVDMNNNNTMSLVTINQHLINMQLMTNMPNNQIIMVKMM
jgi:hypothetical protein